MKNKNATIQTALWFCFLLLLGATACNNDEERIPPMKTSELYDIHFSTEDNNLSILWNGQDTTAYVSLTQVDKDSTKLQLTIYGMSQMLAPQLILDVEPGPNELNLAGKYTTPNYEINVKGYYAKESGILQLNGECHVVQEQLLEQPFVFLINPEYVATGVGYSYPMEWKGETIDAMDFVDIMVDSIFIRAAEDVTAMKIQFYDDCTFDWWLQRAGEAEFTFWMKARYWLSENTNQIYLDFNKEQEQMFYEQWIGFSTTAFSPPISAGILPMTYWCSSGQLNWTISNPQRNRAVSMYTRAKESEERWSKETIDNLWKLYDCLTDVEDDTDWMSWCITHFSVKP